VFRTNFVLVPYQRGCGYPIRSFLCCYNTNTANEPTVHPAYFEHGRHQRQCLHTGSDHRAGVPGGRQKGPDEPGESLPQRRLRRMPAVLRRRDVAQHDDRAMVPGKCAGPDQDGWCDCLPVRIGVDCVDGRGSLHGDFYGMRKHHTWMYFNGVGAEIINTFPLQKYTTVAVLHRRLSLVRMLLHWFLTFWGNLAGSLFVTAIIFKCRLSLNTYPTVIFFLQQI